MRVCAPLPREGRAGDFIVAPVSLHWASPESKIRAMPRIRPSVAGKSVTATFRVWPASRLVGQERLWSFRFLWRIERVARRVWRASVVGGWNAARKKASGSGHNSRTHVMSAPPGNGDSIWVYIGRHAERLISDATLVASAHSRAAVPALLLRTGTSRDRLVGIQVGSIGMT